MELISRFRRPARGFLGVVAVHLLVNTIHGLPHATVPIVAPPLVNATVAVVVYGLPIAGGVLVWRGDGRRGIVVATIGLALSFALAGTLHFVVPGPDNVASAPPGPAGLLFVGTAVLIQVVDGIGVVAGGHLVSDRDGPSLPSSGHIAGVPDAGFRPLVRSTYWAARRTVGDVPEPLTVTAHSPAVLAAVGGFELALDRADALESDLAELATLQAARIAGCAFCLDIGTALAAESDVPPAKLRELHRVETSDAFTERERLVLRYAEAMTRTPVSVPDELVDALSTEFDEGALVELTATVAFENYRARFNSAMGIDAQEFAADVACPVPEPAPASGPPAGSAPVDGGGT